MSYPEDMKPLNGFFSPMGLPSTVMAPLFGVSRPLISFISVVFPLPFGEKSDYPSPFNFKVYIFQCGFFAVAFAESVYLKNKFIHFFPLLPQRI